MSNVAIGNIITDSQYYEKFPIIYAKCFYMIKTDFTIS